MFFVEHPSILLKLYSFYSLYFFFDVVSIWKSISIESVLNFRIFPIQQRILEFKNLDYNFYKVRLRHIKKLVFENLKMRL